MEFAERIIGISNGKVIFDGLPEDLTPAIIGEIYPGLQDPSIDKLVERMAQERAAARAPIAQTSLQPRVA